MTKHPSFIRLPICLLLAAGLVFGSACCGKKNTTNEVPHEFDVVQVYDTATSTWGTVAAMPTPRSTAAAVELDGKLYVIGGSDWKAPGRPRYNVVEAYDPVAGTWETKTHMGTKRECPGAAVVNGKIYVMGGASSSAVFYNTMEVYDPDVGTGGTWTNGPSMATARYGPTVGVIAGKIYVAGGLDVDKHDIGTCEVFDPATNSWLPFNSMPTGRWQAFGGVIDGKLYVVGGFIDADSVTDTHEVFTPPSTWSTNPTSMPAARGEMDGGVYDGKLWVVGGLWQEGTDKYVLDVFQTFYPGTNSWTTLTPMPTARSEAAAAFVAGKLYVAGGYDDRPTLLNW